MRAHIVTSPSQVRFAGSEAEARQIRQRMVDDSGLKKSQINISPIDIPGTKDDLLAFLNDREKTHEAK